MLDLNKKNYFIIGLLFFIGCGGGFFEYSSAKSATRAEKDLKRGEEWGLKALEVETQQNNALVPYFIATEIYKPQERWEEMAEMLDEAMRRNPEQKLEKPILLESDQKLTKDNFDKLYIDTIEKAVNVYRDEAWTILYNKGIELMKGKEDETALQKFNLCIKIDSTRTETYSTIISYYVAQNKLGKAKEYIDMGIKNNPSYILYAMGTELFEQQFLLSKTPDNPKGDKSLINQSERMCLKAIELALLDGEDTGSLKIKWFLINLEMGNNQKAIDIAEELLNIYYDNPDLYFNVAILYQRLATNLFDPAADNYNKMNKDQIFTEEIITGIYKDFIQAKEYAQKSKEHFLSANDLEIEDTGSREAAAEMKNLIKNLKNIYIPSVGEIAKTNQVNLD